MKHHEFLNYNQDSFSQFRYVIVLYAYASLYSLIHAFFFCLIFPCTGMISIPLYIPHTLFDWDFGNKLCAFWLIADYLLCTTSVYNIVLISYDRYQSVSNAVSENINLPSLEDYVLTHLGSKRKNFLRVIFLFSWQTFEDPDYPSVIWH